MLDVCGRMIDYMRISVTDRCNLRCKYCMPCELSSISHDDILRFEEILEICNLAIELGITKFKITGGEPLVRRGSLDFIESLKSLKGVEQVTMTTNGVLLKDALPRLKLMGIDGINISLDALKEEIFEQITGHHHLSEVKEALILSQELGIKTKVNSVLLKGLNDGEFWDLLNLARDYKVDVRFIELMPVGYGRDYQGYDRNRLIERIKTRYPDCVNVSEPRGNGPATYISIPGFKGCIGFIDAIHGKFCEACNRIRLTSDGYLKPCLYYESSLDLKALIRGGVGREDLLEAMKKVVYHKPVEHRFYNDAEGENIEDRKMFQIGG